MTDLEVRFGLVSDIQYSDKDNRSIMDFVRRYREALPKIESCVAEWNGRTDLAFFVHLGDIIDGNETKEQTLREIHEVVAAFERLKGGPCYHVLGNHCLEVAREVLLPLLNMPATYYDFSAGINHTWRFIVLDALDVSVLWPEGAAQRVEAAAWLAAHADKEIHPYANSWNGMLGSQQMLWLKAVLIDAAAHHQRVIVFSHLPILADSARVDHLLWNHADVAALLVHHRCVAAYFAGHYHPGGYACDSGLHFVTMPAICDAPEGSNAYAEVTLTHDTIVIEGHGTVPSRNLPIRPL